LILQVIFTPASREELLAAQDWYETQQAGLGARFLGEVETAVNRMADDPHQFPVVFQDVRRARLRKFPYGLFFLAETDVLVVIACFHGSRDPKHWQKRL
jgi:plasmid stabilization system protein ParE